MYYVYLLECADASIYTGITTDLARRLVEHKKGIGSRYTRARGVARNTKRFLYSEKFATRGEALKREAEIKKWRREKKMRMIKNKKNNF